ncbi:hypothetical protein SVAN01_02617 [Stagonosporopsis vannaccii]|nr:hypothetical protein SVAN01_02617 [Stagonosporopsis vannaccii]
MAIGSPGVAIPRRPRRRQQPAGSATIHPHVALSIVAAAALRAGHWSLLPSAEAPTACASIAVASARPTTPIRLPPHRRQGVPKEGPTPVVGRRRTFTARPGLALLLAAVSRVSFLKHLAAQGQHHHTLRQTGYRCSNGKGPKSRIELNRYSSYTGGYAIRAWALSTLSTGQR